MAKVAATVAGLTGRREEQLTSAAAGERAQNSITMNSITKYLSLKEPIGRFTAAELN